MALARKNVSKFVCVVLSVLMMVSLLSVPMTVSAASTVKAPKFSVSLKTTKVFHIKGGNPLGYADRNSTISVAKVSGASGYQFQWRHAFAGDKNWKTEKLSSSRKYTFKVGGLPIIPTPQYVVRVRAYKIEDGKKVYSDWTQKTLWM